MNEILKAMDFDRYGRLLNTMFWAVSEVTKEMVYFLGAMTVARSYCQRQQFYRSANSILQTLWTMTLNVTEALLVLMAVLWLAVHGSTWLNIFNDQTLPPAGPPPPQSHGLVSNYTTSYDLILNLSAEHVNSTAKDFLPGKYTFLNVPVNSTF